MKYATTFTLYLILICSFPAFSQEKKTFSLKDAQEYAVQHNTKTINARTDIAIAKKKIWETTAIGLPQINGTIGYQNMLKIPTTLIPARIFDPNAPDGTFIEMQFGTQHNATANITLSQLVFQGSYIVALQASKVYLQLSENSLAKSEIDVKESVTQTYYLVLMARYTRDILESSLKNLEKNLYEIQEMFKAGFLEETDVDQLQLTRSEMVNSLNSINRQVSISLRLLKFQMGLDLDREIELSDSLDLIMKRIEVETLLNKGFDYTRHIDFRIVDTQVKAMSLTLKREKFEFLPSITAFLTHQESAMRNSFNFFSNSGEKWFPSSIIGVNINIPIFSSGMRSARVGQARLELEKAKRLKRELTTGLELALSQARSEFSSALEKLQNTKNNVELAKKIYEKTLIKYKQGIATSLELTQTHNQYLASESNHTQAVIELLTAKIKLDKALNQL